MSNVCRDLITWRNTELVWPVMKESWFGFAWVMFGMFLLLILSPVKLPGWSWTDVVLVLVLLMQTGLSGWVLGLSLCFVLSKALSWVCQHLALLAALRSCETGLVGVGTALAQVFLGSWFVFPVEKLLKLHSEDIRWVEGAPPSEKIDGNRENMRRNQQFSWFSD